VVQSNLEYLVGLFQKGSADGETLQWDAVLGKWVAAPPKPGIPTGALCPWPTGTAPLDWVICNGATYNGVGTIYSALYAVIGLTFGGTGATAFKVPDCQGRAVYGVGSGTPGVASIGATEGQPTISLRGPHHGHSYSDPGHRHVTRGQARTSAAGGGDETRDVYTDYTDYSGVNISIGAQGYSIQNAPSHIGLHWIIKL